jgi:DNA-binding IclR family transcriptional regulator
MTEFTICDAESMERELDATRDRGFATDRQENEIGAYCVGMPIFGPFDQVVASISVSGVINRMTPDLVAEIVAQLRDATGRISQSLGRPRGA